MLKKRMHRDSPSKVRFASVDFAAKPSFNTVEDGQGHNRSIEEAISIESVHQSQQEKMNARIKERKFKRDSQLGIATRLGSIDGEGSLPNFNNEAKMYSNVEIKLRLNNLSQKIDLPT